MNVTRLQIRVHRGNILQWTCLDPLNDGIDIVLFYFLLQQWEIRSEEKKFDETFTCFQKNSISVFILSLQIWSNVCGLG